MEQIVSALIMNIISLRTYEWHLDCTEFLMNYVRQIDSKHGIFNFCDSDLIIGASLKEYGEFSEIEFSIMDKFIKDGLFNASAARPLVRLGYMDYGVVGSENTFTKNTPKLGKDGKLEAVKEWDGIYR